MEIKINVGKYFTKLKKRCQNTFNLGFVNTTLLLSMTVSKACEPASVFLTVFAHCAVPRVGNAPTKTCRRSKVETFWYN